MDEDMPHHLLNLTILSPYIPLFGRLLAGHSGIGG